MPMSSARYKQQIAEMEAAMKTTWEEKAKQSESSEKERQRLQQQARFSNPKIGVFNNLKCFFYKTACCMFLVCARQWAGFV